MKAFHVLLASAGLLATAPFLRGDTAFDPGSLAGTNAFFQEILAGRDRAIAEANPLVRKEAVDALKARLGGVNQAAKGRIILWNFKTAFSRNTKGAPAVEVAPNIGGTRINYYVSSGDQVDDVRGIILGGVTKVPLWPKLVAEKDIGADEFRKLKGGEVFPVKGLLQEIKFDLDVAGTIDVYVVRARVFASVDEARDWKPAPLPAPAPAPKPTPKWRADYNQVSPLINPQSQPRRPGNVPALEEVNALVPSLANRRNDVRWKAAQEIGRIAGTDPAAARAAVPELVKLLHDNDNYVRQKAAEALGTIGPAASSAVPDLKQTAANDRDHDVQKAAGDAVRRIQPN